MRHTKLALSSLITLLAAGQALAHTGVRDQTTEGVASYNGFTITHGCGGDAGTTPYPVIGQSAVFPFGNTAVWRDEAGEIIPPTTDASGKVVANNGGGTISATSLSLNVTGYAGSASPFVTTNELVDNLGIVRGLHWKDGAMEPKLNAITPFRVTPPTIVDKCTTLLVRVGVINWCDTGKNATNDASGPYQAPKDAFGKEIPLTALDDGNPDTPAKQKNVAVSPIYAYMSAGNGDNNRADWWFTAPEGGSVLYNDPDLLQSEYWTTITVNNTPADIAACQAEGGIPKVVTVEPSGPDFDKILSPANTKPFTKGTNNF